MDWNAFWEGLSDDTRRFTHRYLRLGVLAGLFGLAKAQPPGTAPRQLADGTENVARDLPQHWRMFTADARRFEQSLKLMTYVTFVATVIVLLLGALVGPGEPKPNPLGIEGHAFLDAAARKAPWCFAILTVLVVVDLVLFAVNLKFFAKVGGVATAITAVSPILIWSGYTSDASLDAGKVTATDTPDRLIGVIERTLGNTGLALGQGLTTFERWVVGFYQKPGRFLFWYAVGVADLVILPYYAHRLAFFLSLVALWAVLMGIVKWRQSEVDQSPILKRARRIAGLALFPVLPLITLAADLAVAFNQLKVVSHWGMGTLVFILLSLGSLYLFGAYGLMIPSADTTSEGGRK